MSGSVGDLLAAQFDPSRGVEMWRIRDAIHRHDEAALAYAMRCERLAEHQPGAAADQQQPRQDEDKGDGFVDFVRLLHGDVLPDSDGSIA
jgi:hypothetical protein